MGKYDWSDGPATLGAHSLAKHTILRRYIEKYVPILSTQGNVPLKLMLIDGFAGGGEYVVEGQGDTIQPGSPLLLINAVRTAEVEINKTRKKPFAVDASYVFIEKNPVTHAYLADTLKKQVGETFLRERVDLRRASFEEQLGGILDRIKGAGSKRPRPIFVLDQYGFNAIPVAMLAEIMTAVPSAEIFLTLAVDHIAAFAKTAGQVLTNLRTAGILLPKHESFFAGTRAMDETATLSKEERGELMLAVQSLLHETFAKSVSAKYFTPFFITSASSHRSYWFLHLANNLRANAVVKELHWEVSNHFEHLGRPGTGMLGFDPTKNRNQLLLPFEFKFDESAKARTVRALVEELPPRFAEEKEKYDRGVPFRDLYGQLSNEIPADPKTLGEAVNRLCGDLALEKRGEKGEERELSTEVKDTDVIRLSRQGRLFT